MKILLPVFVFVAVGVLSASFLHDRPIYASDTLVYIDGAESLATGEGYRTGGSLHTAWPPGYSFFLSLLYRVGIDSITTFKFFNILFAISALLIMFGALSRAECSYALLTVALVGSYFPWIYNTHFVGADMLFCLLFALFLYGSICVVRTGNKWALVVTALSVAFAPVVRMAGVALFVPWIALLLVSIIQVSRLTVGCSPEGSPLLETSSRRRFKVRFVRCCLRSALFYLSLLLLSCLPLALWSARNWGITGEWTSIKTGVTPEYLASMRDLGISQVTLLSKIWVNLWGYIHILLVPDQSRGALLSRLPFVVHIFCLFASLMVVIGWLRAFRSFAFGIMSLSFAIYCGMLLTHNWYDIRYLLPILPLYFCYLLEGSKWALETLLHRIPFGRIPLQAPQYSHCVVKWGCVVLIFVNCAISIASPPARRLRKRAYTGAVQHLYDASQYIREKEANRVLISSVGFSAQWTGASMIPVLGLLDDNNQLSDLQLPADLDFLIQQKDSFVDYDTLYIKPLIEENSDILDLVYSNESVNVYAVLPFQIKSAEEKPRPVSP